MKRDTMINLGFGAILTLLAVTYVYQGGSLWGPCMGGYGGMMGSGMRTGAGFFGLGFHGFGFLFWILVIFFLFLLLSKKDEDKSAIDILNKRFAKGEMSREEYQRTKEEIMGKEEPS